MGSVVTGYFLLGELHPLAYHRNRSTPFDTPVRRLEHPANPAGAGAQCHRIFRINRQGRDSGAELEKGTEDFSGGKNIVPEGRVEPPRESPLARF